MALDRSAGRTVALVGAILAVLLAGLLVVAGRPSASPPATGSAPGDLVGLAPRSGAPGAVPSPATPSAATATPSPAPSPTTVVAPSQRFGMVAHLLWGGDPADAVADLDSIRGAGLGLVRFDVSWRAMEPARGTLTGLDTLDAVMDAVADRGMRAVITVIETPDWANGGRGGWVPPVDPATYARFIGRLAGRYANRDVAWEIWNEPNDPRFWQPRPDPAAYTALLVAASAAIHAADPGVTVLGGSLLYGDTTFLERMYADGAGGAFDGLAVHPYAQVRAPWDTGDPYHSFLGTIDGLRRVMVEHGDEGRGMWLTEVGWAIQPGVDARTRADYLAQAVTMVAARPEIDAMAVYVLDAADDPAFGLLRDGRADPGFAAYADAVRRVAAPPGR